MKGIEAVKALTERFGKPSKELLEMIKTNNKNMAALRNCLKEGPKTVPEMAKETGMESHKVMWYMNAMKKYGETAIEGSANDEGYKSYVLIKGGNNGEG